MWVAGAKQPPVAPAVLPAALAVRLERRAPVAGMQLAEGRAQAVAGFLPLGPVPVHPAVPDSTGLSRSHSEARPGPAQHSAGALRVWSVASARSRRSILPLPEPTRARSEHS